MIPAAIFFIILATIAFGSIAAIETTKSTLTAPCSIQDPCEPTRASVVSMKQDPIAQGRTLRREPEVRKDRKLRLEHSLNEKKYLLSKAGDGEHTKNAVVPVPTAEEEGDDAHDGECDNDKGT